MSISATEVEMVNLWQILNEIFSLNLSFETTEHAIKERKDFLCNNKIGICDMVSFAYREKVDASDIGMQEVELRDLVKILQENPSVHTLLFTGGNSKNGPEYFFRKNLKEYNLSLRTVNKDVPREYKFLLPNSSRTIRTVSLTAPSGAANRAVGSLQAYKKMKAENPSLTTIDFGVRQYKPYFL